MFALPGMDDEIAEKVVAFVDREAGRGAPLSPDDEEMVRRLIERDPAVRALVDELRATNAGLDTLLDDVAAVEVPEKLVSMIRGHGSSDVAIVDHRTEDGNLAPDPKEATANEADHGDVVAFREPQRSGFSYGALAAAAAVALLISTGALYHFYTTFESDRGQLEAALDAADQKVEDQARELIDAKSELSRLAGLSEQAASRNEETTAALAANEETVQRLEVERADLQGRFAVLDDENQRLSDLVEERRLALTESRTASDEVTNQLDDARRTLADAERETENMRARLTANVQDLTAELNEREQEVASLVETLETREEQSAAIRSNLADLAATRAELEQRLTEAEAEKQTLLAAREAAEQVAGEAGAELAALQAEVDDAESRIATIAAGLTSAEAGRREAVQQVFGLEADLAASRSWIGQIAQYHRIYASTARRHLVEVGADELDHIQNWLTNMLGREILVPDLTQFGVTFAGARLLGVNENPVAQLVYLDANDQPLALCIIPSTGSAKTPTNSTNRDLNIVDWRDGQHGFAVVGWSDPALLTSLVGAIQPVYDL